MSNIILMDGAAGTTLWSIAEEHGIAKEPVWKYTIEHPELVLELHRRYIEAGSELIQTNTFGANRPAVERSSSYSVPELVKGAVRLAKQAAEGTDVKIGLAFGPLSVLLEPYGDLEEDECEAIYSEMIDAGVEEGVDCVILETFMDVEMMRIAATAAKKHDIPVFCSITFSDPLHTMMGDTVEKIVDTLAPIGIDAVGMNCSMGPKDAVGVIKHFAEYTKLPLFFKPNSGKPVTLDDGTVVSAYTAENFAEEIAPAIPYVTYIGGCCGCDSGYVKAIKGLL